MDQATRMAGFADGYGPLPEMVWFEWMGKITEGPGGRWVPSVWKVGPHHWQAAATPVANGRPVAGPVVWVCPKAARDAAEKLAWLAAG